MTTVKMKALSKVDKEQINNDLQDINKYTVDTLSADDVYVFDVILCDSEIDRVGDRMSEDFLEELAKRLDWFNRSRLVC